MEEIISYRNNSTVTSRNRLNFQKIPFLMSLIYINFHPYQFKDQQLRLLTHKKLPSINFVLYLNYMHYSIT